jgi:hypothetical protein
MRKFRDPLTAFGIQIALLWTGLSLGVAFLATPAKFLAPSLSLSVALDVGRQTFLVANRVELALCALLFGLTLAGAPRWRWALAFALPMTLVALQTAWLIPALDFRVTMILAGRSPSPSSLHLVYIGVEAAKTLWLGALGLSAWPWRLSSSRILGRALPASGQVISLHAWR